MRRFGGDEGSGGEGRSNTAVMHRRLPVAIIVAAVAVVPPGALWAAGDFRHRRDGASWTVGGADPGSPTFGTPPPPPPPGSRRPGRRRRNGPSTGAASPPPGRRWGPFLVVGNMARERDWASADPPPTPESFSPS